MPMDVMLGEGYSGETLTRRFPGQYRETFRESGYQFMPPGEANGRVTAVNELNGITPIPQDMADWTGSAFSGLGESTAWYQNLNAVQNGLIALHAEFHEVGQSNWDAAVTGNPYAFVGTPWENVVDFTYDKVNAFVLDIIEGLWVTTSRTPTNEQIAWGREATGGLRKLVDLVKTLPPVAGDVASQAEAWGAQIKQNVDKTTALASPKDAAMKEFKESIYSGLKGFGWNIILPIGIIAAVGLAAVYAFKKASS